MTFISKQFPNGISGLDLSPKFQNYIANCLLYISTGISVGNVQINTSRIKLLILFPICSSLSLPMSVKGNSIFLAVQAKNLGVILASSGNLIPHI